mmetsp:Transcript_44819/g.149718  ORF Transcript_44819/g.149718 Transcript_44819/m.149718 type:complete len:205 (-) Transcript_44819:112-726(-)
MAFPVCTIPSYLAHPMSPCMHDLIVSIGCVMTPASSAPLSEPAASAVLRSQPEDSTSFCWISGVTPSIDMVNIASRPIVIVAPRESEEAPYSCTILAGVPSVLPPKRCCWIMHSSQMLHGIPDASPPRKAPPTCTPSWPMPEPARSFWKKPVAPNWTALVPPRFMHAIGRPRYTCSGLNEPFAVVQVVEIGSPCCCVFFHTRKG